MNIELTTTEIETIKREEKALRAASKSWLQAEWQRIFRMADPSELTKTDLVMDLLRSKFGPGAVAAAYAPFVAQEVAYRTLRGDWKRRTIKSRSAFDRFAAKMEEDGLEWRARDAEW